MSEQRQPYCPECDESFDRRDFIRVVGTGTAAVLATGGVQAVRAADEPAKKERPAKPAEALIKELYADLSAEQKAKVVLPWDHGADKGNIPTRLRMENRPHLDLKIGEQYSKPQQELVNRILMSICSGEDGYRQITRNGHFDGTLSFANAGAVIFGNPTDGKFSMVFTSHHLTIRCDGNSEEGAAFGGPMYYGHGISGYEPSSFYLYQTKAVRSVYDALDEKQRQKAVVPKGNPGEGAGSVKLRKDPETMPGILASDLTSDQKSLIESVMRALLTPFRKEDGDEVMEIVKANGGMDKIHLAFYPDGRMNDREPWHFWRLEGPGFVWNFRPLPHIHTFVNISSKV